MINFIVKQVTLHHNKHKNILIQFEIYYRKYTFKPYWVPVLTHYITTCDEISKWKQIDDIKCGNVSDGIILPSSWEAGKSAVLPVNQFLEKNKFEELLVMFQ